jgi:hypothetical protein
MCLLTRQWFEAGLATLQSVRPDLALLCGSSAAFVYSSVCEALQIKFAVADDSPVVPSKFFGPPRGFGSGDGGFGGEQKGDEEGDDPEGSEESLRARRQWRWRTHARSMW